MRLAIINGTNRPGNKTIIVSKKVEGLGKELGFETSIISLDSFSNLLGKEYLTLDNANKNQKEEITKMIEAEIIIFCVPIYHHGIPGSLKNYFDILDCDAAFSDKVFGLISVNNKMGDAGARQTAQVINGVLSFKQLISTVVPQIWCVNPEKIDSAGIKQYLSYCVDFV